MTMDPNLAGNTAAIIENSWDLLSNLRDQTRMTTAMAILAENDNRGIVLSSLPGTGDHAYVPRVGFHFHLHSTAPGKALLAFLPSDQRQERVSSLNFRRFTKQTIADPEEFEAKLRQYAKQKYAEDIGEYAEGVNCVASCICSPKNEPLAAIWITALSVELPESRLPDLAKEVIRTAEAISQRLASRHPDSSPYVDETLEQAKRFIEERFTDEKAIHDYIEGLYMSASWFRKQFKERHGLSPTQYRLQLVLDKAKRLLELTNLPIKEIAFQLGYDSQNYFSRAFKKHEGHSPAQYREQQREADLSDPANSVSKTSTLPPKPT